MLLQSAATSHDYDLDGIVLNQSDYGIRSYALNGDTGALSRTDKKTLNYQGAGLLTNSVTYDAVMWAENAAKKLSEAGVMSGDNNKFMPKKTATRAEVAQLFKNFQRFIAGR